MPNLFRHLYLFCSIETPNQVRGDTVRFPPFYSYAKQLEINFGRNGKRNLSENPFARSKRSERKSYYRRTWLLQTTHWILQTDFAGSGAQN